MKKFIFTETQLKNVIDDVINKQLMTEQYNCELRLHDLSEILSRTGSGDRETFLSILQDVLKSEGHYGVVEFFNEGNRGDVEIEYLGHNVYAIKPPDSHKRSQHYNFSN